jgi:hypothetical protein
MVRLPGFALALVAVALLAGCGGSKGATSTGSPPARSVPAATTVSGRPSASVEPRSGPPGTDVTVSGRGWPAETQVVVTAGNPDAKPYTTAVTDSSGAFTARFFLEKNPDGSALMTGRLNLIAEAGQTRVEVPFLVEVRRPVSGPGGPGG